MRQIFRRCVPEWILCDLHIFTELDLYDMQGTYDRQDLHDLKDLYDLPEWNMGGLNNLYTLTGMRSVQFAGLYDLQDFGIFRRINQS